jgi:formylglycine-generating enzyme required for sulfatase activity
MAMEFCDWLSTITKQNYGLPTDYEWEWAVRGTNKDRKYWWNQAPQKRLCWCRDVLDLNVSRTRSRGDAIVAYNDEATYYYSNNNDQSGTGLLDLHGNVWEWTAGTASALPIPGSISGDFRKTLVGGSWSNRLNFCTAIDKIEKNKNHRGNEIGFRLIKRYKI